MIRWVGRARELGRRRGDIMALAMLVLPNAPAEKEAKQPVLAEIKQHHTRRRREAEPEDDITCSLPE